MNYEPRLQQWAQSISPNIEELRQILGSILKEVNEASDIFKKSVRNPIAAHEDVETIQKAKAIIADIASYDRVLGDLVNIEPRVANNKALVNIIHTLKQSRFTPQQVEELRRITTIDPTKVGDEGFPSEADPEGMKNLMMSSIYNIQNPPDRTLRCIREILQNSADATDSKIHQNTFARRGDNQSPEIRINTHIWNNNEYMDIIVHDNGVGMDWATLSEKFFELFKSGKKNEEGATGGFGIAKALIQESPEHGWSIDTKHENETQPLHSNRFHKNVYMGSKKGSYQTPKSEIVKDSKGGTVLSLYSVPFVPAHRIQQLCSVYASSGKVNIYFDDELMKPQFTLDSPDVKSLSNLDSITSVIADSDSQKETIAATSNKFSEKLDNKLNHLALATSNGKTKIEFFIRKAPYGGKMYVMLNGQYQFDTGNNNRESQYASHINKVDVICSITTTARPGQPEYPLDPGRENIRGALNETVREVVNAIKDFTEKVGSDDLFRQGIDSIMMNDEYKPMSTSRNEFDDPTDKKRKLEDALNFDLSRVMNAPPEEKKATIEKAIEDAVGPVTDIQRAVLDAVMDTLPNSMSRIEEKEKIKQIIEGLTTPANVMIQKNFVNKEMVSNPSQLRNVGEMIILWQKTLKILIDDIKLNLKRAPSKDFIPGLIYSDECLGIYVPNKPDSGRKFATVGINAITLAAATTPKVFFDKLSAQASGEAFSTIAEDSDEQSEKSIDNGGRMANTPINRVTNLLLHIGIHEITHLLFPDSWGDSEFHNNITYIEMACRDSFGKIKEVVKLHIKGLRKGSMALISTIARNKKKKVSESFIRKVTPYVSNMKSIQEWMSPTMIPNVVPFQDWLRTQS